MKKLSLAYLPIVFISLFFLSSCSSLIYNPSVVLPSKPLVKDDFQVSAGIGYYPVVNDENSGIKEPNTDYSNVEKYTMGAGLMLRYGFTDRLALQAKGWINTQSIANDSVTLSGFSFSGIVMLNNPENSIRIGIIPAYALLFSGNTYEGQGMSLLAAFWLPKAFVFYPYAAAGPIFGTDETFSSKRGFGGELSLGTAVRIEPIDERLELNFNLSMLYFYNNYREENAFIASPEIMLSYRF